jgi:CheY-like chemotaxis protein
VSALCRHQERHAFPSIDGIEVHTRMTARLLIVDDEESMSSMLQVVLESYGYDVVTAGSAADALRLLGAESFDLVLTDMKMETDTAGYDVVRAARALPDPPPVVILTAYPLLAKDWRAAGADATLSKPTQISLLLDVVGDLLQKHRDCRPHRS